MNTLSKINEDAVLTLTSSSTEKEHTKDTMNETPLKMERPLMRYLDLLDDSSTSYVLGYN